MFYEPILAFSIGAAFLIVVIIVVLVAVAVFYFGVGAKLEGERGRNAPGDSPLEDEGRPGARPEHSAVEDSTKGTAPRSGTDPGRPVRGSGG